MISRLSGGRRRREQPLAEVVVSPIGRVRNGVRKPRPYGWEDVTSQIVLREGLEAALDGIETYSHLLVLFWLDRVTAEERARLRLRPRDDPANPEVGVFATRSQHRPNPIGVTVVSLLERQGRRLTVRGLDAIDRTPVLDLKPYIPHYDSVPGARLPDWAYGTRRRSPGEPAAR